MAAGDFIKYLHKLGDKLQNGEIDLDNPESLAVSLDGGYTIYDDDHRVLLYVDADGYDDMLTVQARDGAYEHSFSTGGRELWSDEEVDLWNALQEVRGSLY